MRELSSELVHVETEAMGQAQEDCRTWYQEAISERDAALLDKAIHQEMKDKMKYQELCDQCNQEK
eukprot:3280579-Prorocentrum_lima.AAC.1